MVNGIFQGIAVGDINEDGRVDLAVANSVDGAQAFLQNPDGSWRWTPDVLPALQRGAYAVALGDVDRDGHLDLVIGGIRSKAIEDGYGIFIVLGDGKGGWMESEETNLPSAGLERTWGITLGDINGDGLLDFAVSTGGAQGMKMNNPSSLPHMQVWINEHMKG